MRSVLMFVAGFIAGMLFLTLLFWSRGALEAVSAAVPAPAAIIPPTPEPPPAALSEPSEAGLRARGLIIPVLQAKAKNIFDTFHQARDGRRHEAVDIVAPRGTPVVATDYGTIEKLFLSRQGGLTIYEFDPTQTWSYYYAHLDRYAEGLREGMSVRKGEVLGYVGSTGNASPAAPHLHFAIFKLGPEKHWWQGVAIDPYPILMGAAR